MRNIILAVILLTAGGYYLTGAGTLPKVKGSPGGNISGYVNAPKSPVSAARTAGGGILK